MQKYYVLSQELTIRFLLTFSVSIPFCLILFFFWVDGEYLANVQPTIIKAIFFLNHVFLIS
jgi:hypothetical protein